MSYISAIFRKVTKIRNLVHDHNDIVDRDQDRTPRPVPRPGPRPGTETDDVGM